MIDPLEAVGCPGTDGFACEAWRSEVAILEKTGPAEEQHHIGGCHFADTKK